PARGATRSTARPAAFPSRPLGPVAAQRLGERLADSTDLGFADRPAERQRQRALCDALGDRVLAAAKAKAFAVERHQVDAGPVRLGGDPALVEVGDPGPAVGAART